MTPTEFLNKEHQKGLDIMDGTEPMFLTLVDIIDKSTVPIRAFIENCMKEYAQFKCAEQREICFKHAKVKKEMNCIDHTPFRGECLNCGQYHNYEINSNQVDKSSILNSPEPKFE